MTFLLSNPIPCSATLSVGSFASSVFARKKSSQHIWKLTTLKATSFALIIFGVGFACLFFGRWVGGRRKRAMTIGSIVLVLSWQSPKEAGNSLEMKSKYRFNRESKYHRPQHFTFFGAAWGLVKQTTKKWAAGPCLFKSFERAQFEHGCTW